MPAQRAVFEESIDTTSQTLVKKLLPFQFPCLNGLKEKYLSKRPKRFESCKGYVQYWSCKSDFTSNESGSLAWRVSGRNDVAVAPTRQTSIAIRFGYYRTLWWMWVFDLSRWQHWLLVRNIAKCTVNRHVTKLFDFDKKNQQDDWQTRQHNMQILVW